MRLLALWLLLLLPVANCRGQDRLCVRHVVVPSYPVLARMARLQGKIPVRAEVGPDGHVISAKALVGQEVLTRAAERNLQEWTFSPLVPGHNRKYVVTVNYVFKLEGKEDYYDVSSAVTLDLPDTVEIIARPAKLETSTPSN